MQAQRERARAGARKGGGGVPDDVYRQGAAAAGAGSVEFVGYDTLEVEASLRALVTSGGLVASASEGDEVEVILSRSPFYAEGGGQVGDSGVIETPTGRLEVLVLDEADQLLEMGFKPAVDRILSFIPRERQTLLFSATVPQQVRNIAANALRPGYAYVDCVGEEDSATNLQVKQWLTIAPLDDHLILLVQLINMHQQQEPNHKVMCFFPTARSTQLAAELFEALGKPVTEIHSRKSQGHRTKAADKFRASKCAVMM